MIPHGPYALQQRVKSDHNIDVPLGRYWRAKKKWH
jgi:hypothetical protein